MSQRVSCLVDDKYQKFEPRLMLSQMGNIWVACLRKPKFKFCFTVYIDSSILMHM